VIDTDSIFARYLDGRGKMDLQRRCEEKARIPDTRMGGVPLRRGKYGMDVEEYLEHVEWRTKNANTKRKGN